MTADIFDDWAGVATPPESTQPAPPQRLCRMVDARTGSVVYIDADGKSGDNQLKSGSVSF